MLKNHWKIQNIINVLIYWKTDRLQWYSAMSSNDWPHSMNWFICYSCLYCCCCCCFWFYCDTVAQREVSGILNVFPKIRNKPLIMIHHRRYIGLYEYRSSYTCFYIYIYSLELVDNKIIATTTMKAATALFAKKKPTITSQMIMHARLLFIHFYFLSFYIYIFVCI